MKRYIRYTVMVTDIADRRYSPSQGKAESRSPMKAMASAESSRAKRPVAARRGVGFP
jgi:hypothetical protein